MNEERLLAGEIKDDEVHHEVKLRPRDFSEYVGQKRVVQNVIRIIFT